MSAVIFEESFWKLIDRDDHPAMSRRKDEKIPMAVSVAMIGLRSW
jgi:hypothetical protein